jgi:hypothetical protein
MILHDSRTQHDGLASQNRQKPFLFFATTISLLYDKLLNFP